jgi:hypothetical protein
MLTYFVRNEGDGGKWIRDMYDYMKDNCNRKVKREKSRKPTGIFDHFPHWTTEHTC